MLNPFRRRCRICGLPHGAILADHERDDLHREYEELRANNAASKQLLDEQRQVVEGMRAILNAMGTPPQSEVDD